MGKQVPKPMGSLHPNIAPYGETFKTKDKKLVVMAIGSDQQFILLTEIIGAPHLGKDNKYKSNHLRLTNRTQLDIELQPFFKKKTRQELMDQFMEKNIPVGAINDLSEVFENQTAKDLVLNEVMENVLTKRVKTVVFKIS